MGTEQTSRRRKPRLGLSLLLSLLVALSVLPLVVLWQLPRLGQWAVDAYLERSAHEETEVKIRRWGLSTLELGPVRYRDPDIGLDVTLEKVEADYHWLRVWRERRADSLRLGPGEITLDLDVWRRRAESEPVEGTPGMEATPPALFIPVGLLGAESLLIKAVDGERTLAVEAGFWGAMRPDGGWEQSAMFTIPEWGAEGGFAVTLMELQSGAWKAGARVFLPEPWVVFEAWHPDWQSMLPDNLRIGSEALSLELDARGSWKGLEETAVIGDLGAGRAQLDQLELHWSGLAGAAHFSGMDPLAGDLRLHGRFDAARWADEFETRAFAAELSRTPGGMARFALGPVSVRSEWLELGGAIELETDWIGSKFPEASSVSLSLDRIKLEKAPWVADGKGWATADIQGEDNHRKLDMAWGLDFPGLRWEDYALREVHWSGNLKARVGEEIQAFPLPGNEEAGLSDIASFFEAHLSGDTLLNVSGASFGNLGTAYDLQLEIARRETGHGSPWSFEFSGKVEGGRVENARFENMAWRGMVSLDPPNAGTMQTSASRRLQAGWEAGIEGAHYGPVFLRDMRLEGDLSAPFDPVVWAARLSPEKDAATGEDSMGMPHNGWAWRDLPAGRLQAGIGEVALPGTVALRGLSILFQHEGPEEKVSHPLGLEARVSEAIYRGLAFRAGAVKGEMSPDAGGMQFRLTAQEAEPFRGQFHYLLEDDDTVRYLWSGALEPWSLKGSRLAGLLGPEWGDARSDGVVQATLNGDWSTHSGWNGQGKLAVKELSVNAGELDFELSGGYIDLAVSGLNPVATAKNQEFTARSFRKGQLDAADLRVRFSLHGPGHLEMDRIRFDTFGGQVRIDAFQWLEETPDLKLVIHLRDIDVGEVMKLMDDFPGELRGRLNGLIRIRWKENNIHFGRGFLELSPGTEGQMRLNLDRRPVDPDAPAYDFLRNLAQTQAAVESLRHVRVQRMRLDFFNEDRPENPNQLRLKGVSLSLRPTAPLDLTVNLQGDVEEALRQFLRFLLGIG